MKKSTINMALAAFSFILFISIFNISVLYAQKGPVITDQPDDVEFCLPDTRASVSFTVVATGAVAYQWQGYNPKTRLWTDLSDIKGVISGTATVTLTVYKPAAGWSTSNSADFRVIVTDRVGYSVTSSTASLIINSPAIITADPVNDTIWIGETATLSASSSGKPTPGKQWQKYAKLWLDISGATSSTYTTGTAGRYRLKISNTCATAVYSNYADLFVMGITSQPENVTVCAGYNTAVSFTVGTSGATAYQWEKYYKLVWSALKGATSATYTINPPAGGFTSSYTAQYRCKVTFPIGTQTSSSAYFTVNNKPSISAHPVSQSKNEGESVTFNVSASSTLTKTYQWYKDNNPVAGATGSSLTLSNLQLSDAGDYKCTVTNDCGSTTSNTATLTVVKLNWPQEWFSQRFNSEPINSKNMYDVCAVDENTAWAVVTEENDNLIYTTDGGETWNWTLTGVTHYRSWKSIFFTDANHGWVGGSNTIAYTTNGGSTWNEWYDVTAIYSWNDLFFINSSVGWAAGTDGRLYKTEDGGISWTEKKNTGSDMYGIHFADANHGVAVGDAGIIVYTVNGGTSWTTSTDPDIPIAVVNAVCMIDASTVYAITSSAFLKSTNGGATWDKIVTSPTNIGGYGMDFVSSTKGWICTTLGKIYYTNNGGTNWYLQTTETTSWLKSISMVDSDNGWAIGYDGATQRTAFGGCRLPRVSLYDDKELCASSSYLLRADTFGVTNPKYLWSTGQTAGNISVVSPGGKYWVDVWNVCGDKANDTINVHFFDLPEAYAGEDTAVCYGDTVQFNASGGVIYSWDHGSYLSDPGIPNPLAAPPVGNTNFTVSVTDTNGCVNTDQILMTVYQIPTSIFTSPATGCEGIANLFSYNGNASPEANYAWNFDEGTVTPLGNESYNVSWDTSGIISISLAVEENGCISDTTRLTFQVYPIPVSGFSLQAGICGNDTIDILYEGVGSPEADYEWDFDDGTIHSGVNEGPYQVYWLTGGSKTISLQVTQDGCVSSLTEKQVTVSYPFENEEICMVTVDPETGKNMVVWWKTPNAGIAAYKVYRETNVKDVYEYLATVPYESPSLYIDVTSKPKNKAYLYKISVVDTCDNESLKSAYHKTLFLQYGGSVEGVIMNWGKYIIQGGDIDFVSYIIYRGSDTTALQPIDTVSASLDQYTDTDPDALAGKRYYRIAGVKATSCSALEKVGKKAGTGPYSHSLSNIEDNRLQSSGVSDIQSMKFDFRIYPNPFRQTAMISYQLTERADVKIEVYNLLGARIMTVVNENQVPGDYNYDLRADKLGSVEGIYYLRFTANGESLVKKVIQSR